MFLSMDFSHLWNWFIHKILSSYMERWWEMIDFLVFCECRVNNWFKSTATPHQSPIFAFLCLNFSKAVIFKSISYDCNIVVVHFKIITSILRWVWSNRNRVLIRSKYQELLFYFRTNLFRANIFIIKFWILRIFLKLWLRKFIFFK